MFINERLTNNVRFIVYSSLALVSLTVLLPPSLMRDRNSDVNLGMCVLFVRFVQCRVYFHGYFLFGNEEIIFSVSCVLFYVLMNLCVFVNKDCAEIVRLMCEKLFTISDSIVLIWKMV